MSWIWIVVIFAIVIPAMSRRMRHGMRYSLDEGQGRYGKGPGHRERIEALEAELDERLDELRALEARVGELENRLDFTERLLAASRTDEGEGVRA